MRQKLLSLCFACAGVFGLAPQLWAQDDIKLSLDLQKMGDVEIESMLDGSWQINSTGGDPRVAISALERDLTDDEVTLTFEYKVDKFDYLEIFFSEKTGYTYATGRSYDLGKIPVASEWTRVNLDLTRARKDWHWGHEGQTMRFDPGTDPGVRFSIRDIRITKERTDMLEPFTVQDGRIQINNQEDFEYWYTNLRAFPLMDSLRWMDVDINTNVKASSTEGHVFTDFYATIDGHFNTITMDIHGPAEPTTTGNGTALMQNLYGTVQNVYFDGEIEGSTKFLGTVAKDICKSGRLLNVWSSTNLISHINGDGTHGGLAGRILGGTVKNVVYAGKISNPEGVTKQCGGVIGWSDAPSNFENVLMIGDISEICEDASNNTISRNSGNIIGRNVFANTFKDAAPDCCTIITDEDLASGLITFLFNGDQTIIDWYQTLGEDAFPTFDNTHKRVYAAGQLNCDGTIDGEASFTNDASQASQVPDHHFVDGVCTECGANEPGFVELVDGWYVITTPEQFCYIAKLASAYNTIKIKIGEDLDMAGYEYSPITGSYAGTLDGQFHTISNLVINDPETRGRALIAQAGPCTIKNLTLDASCYIEGGPYSAGFVGESSASGTITMDGLFMHGDVVAHGANAAAIYACNMGTVASKVVMRNCGMSGHVKGEKESGLMTGWFGGKGEVENCWAVGTVEGSDGSDAAQFSRPSSGDDKFTNCYTVQGKRDAYTTIPADAAQTGYLTWLLNGKSFKDPKWFQNLNEDDPFPSLDPSRGIIYPTADGYETMDPADPNSFEKFLAGFAGVAKAYLESADVAEFCAVALVEQYTECVDAYEGLDNVEDFQLVYEAEQAKKKELESSIKAYKAYIAIVEEIMATLASRDDFSGDARDLVENYIDGGVAAGENEDMPNGSFDFIMETRALTVTQLAEEGRFAQELLRRAVANGYSVGTDLTDLLVNGYFTDGWNGWNGNMFTANYATKREGRTTHSIEGFGSAAWHIYQDVVVGKSGIYELKVNGAWRPFNEWLYNSIEYYPYIYLNGNVNYLMSNIEDYMPREEAVDGVNCCLDSNYGLVDLDFVNEAGDSIGYVMHGQQSICDAIDANRYENRILIKLAAGDTLRVGVNHPRSEYKANANEWVGFGGLQLVYQGSLDEAGEALDRVLKSMSDRANNMLAIEPSTDETYVKFTNWSNSIKDRIRAALEKAQSDDANEKYEAIEEMSAAFLDAIDSKKAYRRFFAAVENAHSAAYAASDLDPERCGYMTALADDIFMEGMEAYINGDMSTEEADACDFLKQLPVKAAVDEKGVYHIGNTAQYVDFVQIANKATADDVQVFNAVLDGDVFMNESLIINHFYGTFDGQGHTMFVDITRDADIAAPFGALRKGATVKNLIVRGAINTTAKFAAGVSAHIYDGANIDRVASYVDIIADRTGDGTHGGILAVNDSGTGTITNCLFAGSMTGAGCDSNGGIVGWSGSTANVSNSFVVANISTSSASSNIIGRANTYAKNCFFVTPYGGTPSGATQITEEDLANGAVAVGLNGGSSRRDVIWRQNLGEDLIPTFDPTHKVVYRKADGTYSNEPQNEIEFHMGTKDDPFIINTAADMALLRAMMTTGAVNYIKLGADIDMAGIEDWEPLNQDGDRLPGSVNYANMVDFDGQGHVIKNFTATNPDKAYNSFFGVLCGNVRNVGFENVNVDCAVSGTGVVAGYMGHDQFIAQDASKLTSTIANVWVTGKLNVALAYAGGLVGHVGGPSVIKNCYTNLVITGEADYNGGIVGRVRDELTMDGVYAAGSIESTGNVGGIIGGAQQSTTPPATYNNIAVWNNTDSNFGPIVNASNQKLPEADLLDVVFNADGTVEDRSPMANPIEVIGEVETTTNETFNTTAYLSKDNNGGAKGVNYLKIDYSQNEAFKETLTHGYTMETTFIVHQDLPFPGIIKPFCTTNSGGFGFQIQEDGRMQGLIHTTLEDGTSDYRIATAGVYLQPGLLYHVVTVYDTVAEEVAIYMNGGNKGRATASGKLHLSENELAQWIGIGADPNNKLDESESAARFEILNARIYSQVANDAIAKALYYKQAKANVDFYGGDKTSNISFYNGNNFAELQSTVVGWGKPWTCDMKEGSYPVFDGSQTAIGSVKAATSSKIYNINGIEVEKAANGIFIINGKKVLK